MTEAILAAHADPDQPAATFRAVQEALATDPGHILFTILVQGLSIEQLVRRLKLREPRAIPEAR